MAVTTAVFSSEWNTSREARMARTEVQMALSRVKASVGHDKVGKSFGDLPLKYCV